MNDNHVIDGWLAQLRFDSRRDRRPGLVFGDAPTADVVATAPAAATSQVAAGAVLSC